MDLGIAGRAVVVTGAAQGIGRALALGLAEQGARVAVVARDTARAEAVVDEIAALDGAPAALAVRADVTDEVQVAAVGEQVEAAFGRIDGLVNNAGWMPGSHPVAGLEVALLDDVLRVNLTSAFLCTKHLVPRMARTGGGRVIYLSSAASVQGVPGGFAYSAAKAALNQLSVVVHREHADAGIRTTAIAPGLTVSPGMEAVMTPEHLERTASRYPGGRVGQPDDLVGLVAFLCGPGAAHLSGTFLMVRPPV